MKTAQIEKWDYFEYSLTAETDKNPFIDISFQANFCHADRQVTVNGFYDGDGLFKLRFMPELEGEWCYTTHSNLAALDGKTGTLNCLPPSAQNHGPVRVAQRTHFAYEDGTPYLPVGTTCYVWNLQGDELEEQTLRSLKNAPFNKLRMCVFPKHYQFNHNEPPCYPFPRASSQGWDFSRFNPAYFQHLEKRILDLRDQGIEADLILFHPYDSGAWGFDRLPPEVNDRYLQMLVARLAAFRNVWWSFANEYDLMSGRTLQDWDHYFQLVQAADPYHHLRSIHNCGTFYDHTQPWVTHCSIQHSATSRVPLWLAKYNKPVIVDECGYEGNISMVWGDLSPEEMIQRFWFGFVQGGHVGHGETYLNPEEVLWWSKGGQLTGQSVERIRFLRAIFEQAPQLTPMAKNDMEFLNLMNRTPESQLAGSQENEAQFIAEGSWNHEAGGFNAEHQYYLFYFGMHQPAERNFSFSSGTYRIDLIDTWNMTIEPVTASASGLTQVKMPGRKYMAIRIQKNVES